MPQFIHLHNHSHYSLLDGACKVGELLQAAADCHMPSLALTDHGNMFGAVDFYKKARELGVKPIIGVEAYVAPHSRKDRKSEKGISDTSYHLVLLAKNKEGYQNLMRLVSIGYLEGFYYRPRIDKAVLRKYNDGLVALSACLKGEVSSALLNKGYEAAKAQALEYREIFKDDYYLEIQNHGIDKEKQAREGIIQLGQELGIPVVATNDIHYLKREHCSPHDVLICLQTGKDRDDPKRLRYTTDQIYFKTQQEMAETFAGFSEALSNTADVANKCNLDLDFGTTYLPRFEIPENETVETLEAYLEKLAFEGARTRFGTLSSEIEARLRHELGIINAMGYAGYFLIVMDFINYAKQHDIPVGPGRGSAAGSLVSYCLGITNIDPLRYNLIFERFLNPERVTMPDIDIDFCYERRDEIIKYVRQKYGEKNVTQIITFGTMAARAVIRDVGRVLKIRYSDVDRIAKMIPAGPNMTLRKALESIPDFQKLASQDEVHSQLIDYSRVLEGLARHASTHAAGVVITPDELTKYTPLYKSTQGDVTTQYDMKCLEDIGVLKMDFLGLRTLTVIDKTVKSLAKKGIEIDIDHVRLDDPETYELFANGETVAIFQFESSGMREYLRKLKPQAFEDLIAMNALYRPGPMEWIDDFIQRKHGQKTIEYLHPSLEPILNETYGIIVYQEQVMRIASELAGFSMGKADLLRRAMGKKKPELMAQQRNLFLEGCRKNDIPEELANKIFDLMDKFAGYGFVKPHSTCYAFVAFQTAYLKRHYPAEFMAATLTSEMGSSNRVVVLLEECKRMGITVHPPDVNKSFADFVVENGGIRFGLGAVKNVGKNAIQAIVQAREEEGPFSNLFEFCERVGVRLTNKKVLESLIQSGAMDSVEGHRAQKLGSLETAISFAQSAESQRSKGQTTLFDDQPDSSYQYPPLAMVAEWSKAEALAYEKEMLGFYFSGHPLDKFSNEVKIFSSVTLDALESLKDGSAVKVCGIVTEFKSILDRKNNPMAFLTLEDFHGSAEVIVFSKIFDKYREILQPDAMIMVAGRTSTREDEETKILCDEIVPLAQVWDRFAKNLYLNMEPMGVDDPILNQVNEILKNNPGDCNLFINLKVRNQTKQTIKSRKMKVNPDPEVIMNLQSILGQENVWMEG
ncbi:DNA polymerase III subunit alpha [candidate division KSB1 bacterium]|nr:DNA polymerase III subunit alpha [candidate division KSB1 bacterium]NIR73355.1 DNA polymerase III subunit alpha [candidate division KSB1 bacterium]NIS25235.1 DNA polymerase III subunit alpha [candidate division KSB1 bacterium]NIT72138.1 DNA polymerase III subunit alpha [candidate division KSB1 bacterium]NIU25944.1 DNA polymerase III subunit alpha [candidate division KSB1 bacterium]